MPSVYQFYPLNAPPSHTWLLMVLNRMETQFGTRQTQTCTMLQDEGNRGLLPQITALCFSHLQDCRSTINPNATSMDSLRMRIPAYPVQILHWSTYNKEQQETLWGLAGLALPSWPEYLISDQLTNCYPWNATKKRKIFHDRSIKVVVEIVDWILFSGKNTQITCLVEADIFNTRGRDITNNQKKATPDSIVQCIVECIFRMAIRAVMAQATATTPTVLAVVCGIADKSNTMITMLAERCRLARLTEVVYVGLQNERNTFTLDLTFGPHLNEAWCKVGYRLNNNETETVKLAFEAVGGGMKKTVAIVEDKIEVVLSPYSGSNKERPQIAEMKKALNPRFPVAVPIAAPIADTATERLPLSFELFEPVEITETSFSTAEEFVLAATSNNSLCSHLFVKQEERYVQIAVYCARPDFEETGVTQVRLPDCHGLECQDCSINECDLWGFSSNDLVHRITKGKCVEYKNTQPLS